MTYRTLFLSLLAASLAGAAPAGPRIEKTINRDFAFQYFPAEGPDLRAAQGGFDDSHWPAVAVPHTWSAYETTGDLHPFIRSAAERDDSYWWYGWGWYRKQLVIGKQYAGRLIECDRLGSILIEELPNIKDITFGRDVQRIMLKETIRRDRNHPSIFIWSIGNESNQSADSRWGHEEDPSRVVYLRRGENGGDFVILTDKDLPIENLLRCTVRGWYSQDDRDFGEATRNPSSGQITGTESWQHETCVRSDKLADDNVEVWLYADHGWREQYQGKREPIVVDSNCDEVTLKVNGQSVGTLKPTTANNHSVTFENVDVRRRTISGAERVASSLTMAGKPAKLMLKPSANQIGADRSSVAVLAADIVDAAGVHVYGATAPLTWTVSGPGTLVGPGVYQTDTGKKEAMDGTMYIDAPVANLVRSTATAGTIRVKIAAPCLEPAEAVITSVQPAVARVAGIGEPPVGDAGRVKVTRVAGFRTVTMASKPSSKNMITEISDDTDFKMGSREEVKTQIDNFVKARNPKLDRTTAEYGAFLDRITTIVVERNGHLVADDYNFNARGFAAKPQAAQAGRPALLGRIKEALFVPDPLPALTSQTYGQFEVAPGVIAERVSYATDYGLRVPAIVYRPKQLPAGKLPGLIVVNGHGGDKYSWYAFYAGILYARAGAAVVTYDPIGEGERNAQRKNGTRQHDRNVDPPEMGKRMGGLMITDVMQAVSYLSSRPDVDPKRLAAMGYSMGSFVLGLTCAVETRLNSCVLVGGGNLDGEGGYWDSSSKKMCQAIPYQTLKFLGDRGAALYDLHAARGSTLVWNGSADDVVGIPGMGQIFFADLRKRVIALHGSDHNVFDFGFEPGGGHRPYFLTRPAALWLQAHLKFPSWTSQSIARMPETHILEWATGNNVFMDKLYATELREGGTRALGTGVPPVAHDLLNALPLAQWERDKDQYVYETWLREARSRLVEK